MTWKTDDTQTRRGEDGRRSPRILSRVRLRLESEETGVCDATTAVINAHGALVLAPVSFPEESRIRITNIDRGSRGAFRVVWRGEPAGSLHKLGVEMLAPDRYFWGISYRPEAQD